MNINIIGISSNFKKAIITIFSLIILALVCWKANIFVIAEQSGSSPESGTISRFKTLSDSLSSLGYGSTSAGTWGDWGTMWNRIYSSVLWTPSDATATVSDVAAGKTFYAGSNRVKQTGQAAVQDPPAPVTPDAGDASRINTLYKSVKTLSYGSESSGSWGDLGAMWNRTYSSALWTPSDATATTADVSFGKTFYAGNNRTIQTGSNFLEATGGIITYTDSNGLNPRSSPAYPGGYIVHTFLTSGNFMVPSDRDVDVLVVAGGGGGGNSRSAGGGGGGVIYEPSFSITKQTYSVTIGNGGIAGNPSIEIGGNGSNSIFSTLTAIGGGGGAGYTYTANGNNGGSGGGGAGWQVGPNDGGIAIIGQGNNGGKGTGNVGIGGWTAGGGGGGAGAVGADATGTGEVYTNNLPGAGGIGIANSIAGSVIYYAGGGGGHGITSAATESYASGGNGGGGSGGSNGIVNTGGGGGTNAAGGSGIVIIRYITP